MRFVCFHVPSFSPRSRYIVRLLTLISSLLLILASHRFTPSECTVREELELPNTSTTPLTSKLEILPTPSLDPSWIESISSLEPSERPTEVSEDTSLDQPIWWIVSSSVFVSLVASWPSLSLTPFLLLLSFAVVRSYAPGFIFTTSLPPAIVAGAQAAIAYQKECVGDRRLQHLNTRSLKAELEKRGLPVV